MKENFKPSSGIAVDGSCIGNPGPAEYRGVDLRTGKQIFSNNIGESTNNVAEFLAIVHALAYSQRENIQCEIYSDSTTAIAWVKNRYANTKIRSELVERAENWLRENEYNLPLKWNTRAWGEIPADYGRK